MAAIDGHAQTATYPDRPVKMFVGFAAGGGTDVAARILAQKLTEAWGQSVVVENKPGAGCNIGAPCPQPGQCVMPTGSCEMS